MSGEVLAFKGKDDQQIRMHVEDDSMFAAKLYCSGLYEVLSESIPIHSFKYQGDRNTGTIKISAYDIQMDKKGQFYCDDPKRQASLRLGLEPSIASMVLTPVPHCCGLLLGSGFRVNLEFNNQITVLDKMFEWFEDVSWEEFERYQVTYISTNLQTNINEVLKARSYEKVYTFVNANSGNKIHSWFKAVEGDYQYDDDYEDDYDDEY